MRKTHNSQEKESKRVQKTGTARSKHTDTLEKKQEKRDG